MVGAVTNDSSQASDCDTTPSWLGNGHTGMGDGIWRKAMALPSISSSTVCCGRGATTNRRPVHPAQRVNCH